MSTKEGVAAILLISLAACGGRSSGAGGLPATQQFNRQVDANPARVVAATLATFSHYGIPVASSDETKGEVRSVPLDLRGQWGQAPTADKLNCPPGTADTATGHVSFDAKAKPSSGGSMITLTAQRSGSGQCVVRTSFVTELLDAIAKESRS